MGTIKLKNIRTFSYHGCLIEEGKIGSDYSVDLEIKTDLRKSCVSDDLNDTVDYVLLNKIVVEMDIRSFTSMWTSFKDFSEAQYLEYY
jgi:dihydroneopterin aldolase